MFERVHHQRIARVLQALDAPGFLARHCLFGGGTAMALRYGEYRESVDIDFLVSDLAGYRELRQLLTGTRGLHAMASDPSAFKLAREVRADQYGIRTLLLVDEAAIKFEIILEARIQLEPPRDQDRICGVATITPLDMATSKLLANSDRWADDSVFSRDLIDLAMMQPRGKLLQAALQKASLAYGASVQTDLARAIEVLTRREGHLERCMQAMRMTLPKALLWQRIKALTARRTSATPAAATK